VLAIIKKAKMTLEENGVIPTWIKVSPRVHDQLLTEINQKNHGKSIRIFEICGLKLEIDHECPSGGAYIEGR